MSNGPAAGLSFKLTVVSATFRNDLYWAFLLCCKGRSYVKRGMLRPSQRNRTEILGSKARRHRSRLLGSLFITDGMDLLFSRIPGLSTGVRRAFTLFRLRFILQSGGGRED